jgi:Innexin
MARYYRIWAYTVFSTGNFKIVVPYPSDSVRFFFCELLNFVNVVGQIYFMDLFLGGEFTTYGRDVVSMTEAEPDQRTDPMSRVFPKVSPQTKTSHNNLELTWCIVPGSADRGVKGYMMSTSPKMQLW